MLIRIAGADEVAALAACAEIAYGRYIERMGRRPAPMDADWAGQIAAGQVLVAEVEGALAGYIVRYADSAAMHIEAIAVLPEHQGKGIGRALIAHVEDEARRGGFAALELYTNEKMHENLVLYPRLGFVETGRRIQDGYARVFFRKALSRV